MTTWNDITAGDNGTASTAMQNWIHSGRMGVNFLPITATGAFDTAGAYNIGGLTNPWGDVYLDAGKKIYVGGVEFSGGGGGSASGLDTLALANYFDKIGQPVPLVTSNTSVRNAFTDDTRLMLWLRESYSTADTTTAIFDHGLESELENINDCQTPADFTAGTNTPTIAADTTNFLEGTQSTKLTKTVSGSVDAYVTETVSLTDRDARFSIYIDNLTDVSEVYAILYTSSGNQRKLSFDPSLLSVDTWEHLTIDTSIADGDTDGGVTVTDTGTFVISSITQIYIGWTTISSQAVNMSVSSIRAIAEEPLLVPDYGLSLTIEDATNQESLTILSESLTDNTTKGTFTLASTLTNNYTADIDATFVSDSTGTISNNQFTHNADASGDGAKVAVQREIKELDETLTSADFEAFVRFYHEKYEVTDFPSTSTIEIYTETDKSGYFLNDDYILLFKLARAGRKKQSMRGSDTINFLRLQLNTDATFSSDTVTLTHDGSNSVGSDTTGYYVIPESVALSCIAGAKSASTFTDLVPEKLLVNKNDGISFDENPYLFSNWAMDGTGNAIDKVSSYTLNENGTVPSVSGLINKARGNFSSSNYFNWGASGSGATIYDSNEFIIEFWVKTTGIGQNIIGKRATTAGWWVDMHNNSARFTVWGTTAISGSTVINDGNWHHILAGVRSNSGADEVRLYIDGSEEGTARAGLTWSKSTNDLVVGGATGFLTFTGYLDDVAYWESVPDSWVEIEDILAKRYNSGKGKPYGENAGYTIKYSDEGLTDVDKIETEVKLKRNDTTNQTPVIYGMGAEIY